MESSQENLWNKIQLKGPQRRKYTLEQNQKGAGKLGWFMSDLNHNVPTTWRWARGDIRLQH